MEIVKFGGSSMATVDNIKQCATIVKSNSQHLVIVVSAPGKYGAFTSKITDDLIKVTQDINLLETVIKRFEDLAKALLDVSKYQTYTKILQQTQIAIKNAHDTPAYIISRGEYLMAQLFALYLNYNFIDAENILIINPDATINLTATAKQIKQHHLRNQMPFVIGGFYGQRDGHTALFTRGGSDYTGAILAVLMHAKLYKNYTDTNGIQTADPRLVFNTRTITSLDFDSLDLLTHNGACIIHENVAELLKTYRVPLRVDNTFAPNKIYTEVHSLQCQHCEQNFFCVTQQDNHILVINKKHGQPATVQIINTTPASAIHDVQKLHADLLKQL